MINPKLVNQILSMSRRLNRYAKELGMGYSCDVKILEVSLAHSQVENGKTYKYPETLDIKIENHSNHFYSVRTKDGRWITEGTKLSGTGRSIRQVYRAMRLELRAHAETIFKDNVEKITHADVIALRASKRGV